MSKRGGRYACLYGDFWRHNRWAVLSPAAAGLWARSVSYSADNGSDGEFPWAFVIAWCAGHNCDSAIAELLAGPRPRWKRKNETTGQVCHYEDNQPTRAEWEDRIKNESAKRADRRTRAGLHLVSGADKGRTGGRT